MLTSRNLEEALSELADLLRADISEIVERGLAQMRQELPEFFVRDEDPDFVEIYRQSYHDQLGLMCDGLARRQDLQRWEMPALAVAEARMSANFGIKPGSLLVGYRISHRLFLDEAMQRAEASIADRGVRGAVLRATSTWMFTYFDWVTLRMTEVYHVERSASGNARRGRRAGRRWRRREGAVRRHDGVAGDRRRRRGGWRAVVAGGHHRPLRASARGQVRHGHRCRRARPRRGAANARSVRRGAREPLAP